jgi:hypothetical protein
MKVFVRMKVKKRLIEVGFEPTKHNISDLKSDPFDRSGTQPVYTCWVKCTKPHLLLVGGFCSTFVKSGKY